jgi:DNA primase
MTVFKEHKATNLSLVEEIKRQVKIEDVLKQYGRLNLKRNQRFNGRSYNIKCPFHSDRRPSFSIWPKTNTWKCQAGCGNGDVINLVSKFLSITNKEAISLLKKQHRIESKLTSTQYFLLQNDRDLLRGFEETKEQIKSELLRYRYIFNQAMKQVASLDDLEKLVEVYHFKPLIDKYLEEIDSEDFEIQVAAVKHLKPLFLEVKI